MGFWDGIKEKITDTVKIIQVNPVLDSFAKSALVEIPVVGRLLLDLYENSKGTDEEKSQQILRLLRNYEKMSEDNLSKTLRKLEENKEEIINNHDYLEILVADTEIILTKLELHSEKLDSVKTEIGKLAEVQKEMCLILREQKIDAFILPNFKPMIKAELEEKIKKFEKEKEELQKQLEEAGERPKIDLDLILRESSYYYYEGKFDTALAFTETVLKMDKKNAYALYNKGLILEAKQEYSEALKYYSKSIKEKPGVADVWTNKSNILCHFGRFEDAIVHCNTALKINPSDELAWNNKGFALLCLGELEESISCFDQALKINSNYHKAEQNKIYALSKMNNQNNIPY